MAKILKAYSRMEFQFYLGCVHKFDIEGEGKEGRG